MARLGAVLRVRLYMSMLVLALILLSVPARAPGRSSSAPRLPGTPVPGTFVGMDIGGPLFNTGVDLAQQLKLMVASGVQTVRVVFNWSQAQPFASPADVPPDLRGSFVTVNGVPTDFQATDTIVGMAAANGLAVLPTVLFAPAWDQGKNRSGGFPPPKSSAPYANYLKALIGRYGPHGSFWATTRPRMPIRRWQIWNEPNLPLYWPQPFASSYVGLLKAAHAAIKQADPGAKIVLGAITNRAWKYLGQIYRIHGAKRLFDVIAVNGFTRTPNDVVTFLQLVRRAVNRLGDPRKPLLATELSWPSAAGKPVRKFDWDTTERGEARNISQLLPLLAAHRQTLRLSGFDYYTWVTQESPANDDNFNFAGLLRYSKSSDRIVAKPALRAFKKAALAIELCGKKGARATQCVKRG